MTSDVLHIDFETKSTVDLKKTGSFIYAQDPTTDLWCACYAFNDEPVQTWLPGQPVPDRLAKHVLAGGLVYAHNARFEKNIWDFILGPRYGWPKPNLRQYRCTMAMANAMALPASLGLAAAALGLPEEKDYSGYRLMLQMCRPRKPRKGEDPKAILWWEDQDKLERLIAYCVQDVETERAAEKRMRPLSDSEQELWFVDQIINERGFHIDRAAVLDALYVAQDSGNALDRQMKDLTDGAVPTLSSNEKLKKWISGRGYGEISGVGATVLDDFVEKNDMLLDDKTREVIQVRRDGAATSIRKLDSMLRRAGPDDRCRENYIFSGAGTRRWTAVGVQTQNMVRQAPPNIEELFRALTFRNADWLDIVHGFPITIIKKLMRSMICAAPGNDLISADFNNIEGVGISWLAGQDDKLEAFRKAFAGDGPGIYEVAAGGIYNKASEEVTKDERQIGKVSELACGYQGGVGAFQSMAAIYGVKVPDSQADQIKEAWRDAHPAIVTYWYDLKDAAFAAISDRGGRYGAGPKDHRRIFYRVVDNILWCKLPSGGVLSYPSPQLKESVFCKVTDPAKGKTGVRTVFVDEIEKLRAKGMEVEEQGSPELGISYMTVDQFTRKWQRTQTYGGKLAENVTQATARDLLAEALKRLEKENYPVVLHVHDEAVSEIPEDYGDLREYEEIMEEPPAWASGFPIKAEGWRGHRYRK